MRAAVHIREQPSYRFESFKTGLLRLGYKVVPYFQRGRPESRDDLLVLWNLHRDTEGAAADWEGHGGTVVVCENGYVGQDNQGRQLYAISVHGHNGAGWFPVGEQDRFSALGLNLEPWQANESGHVLVCGQRGVGSKAMASPPNWHGRAAETVRRVAKRQVRVRLHPGNKGPAPGAPTLSDDLRGAWACVVWSSSSGVKALLAGVPVFFDAPHWICAEAGRRLDTISDGPLCSDEWRLASLRRMAYGQWRVAEIESGEPFARIRDRISEAKWT